MVTLVVVIGVMFCMLTFIMLVMWIDDVKEEAYNAGYNAGMGAVERANNLPIGYRIP